MQTFQSTPSWMVIEQLEQLFTIQKIEPDAQTIPGEIDILMLIHPKQLTEAQLFSIDQFLMGGGKLLAFVDPLAELDRPAQANPMMPVAPTGQASSLNRLTEAWGVTLRPNVVLGDAQTALSVSSASGTPVRHLGHTGDGSGQFLQRRYRDVVP